MRASLLALALLLTISRAWGQLTETFWYRGDSYKLEVKTEVFKATPLWDPDVQPNPPFSAARALKEAFKFTSKLEQKSGWTYHLDGLSLIQSGSQWYWEARFSRYQYIDGLRKGDEQTRCWILMDGTVVEPVLAVNSGTNLFPEIPPVADADPSIRHPVSVRVPIAMRVLRQGDSLTVSFLSLQTTNLMVGHKMVTGIIREERVFRGGVTQPRGITMQDGLGFESTTNVFTLARHEIPKAGQDFSFEYRVTMFETDLPSQHMWSPQSGKYYRVLWSQAFKESIQ